MPNTTFFRIILIVCLVTAVISGIASISLTDTLPPSLQVYVAQVDNTGLSVGGQLLFLILILAFMVISIIGLWKFKRWARTLYIVVTIISIVFTPTIGPVVMNSWEAMFSDITYTLEGILIAMMFTGTVAQKFNISS